MAWSLTNLFRRRFLKPAPRKPIRRRGSRLALERLEDRLAPANVNVTSFHYDPFIQGQDTQETNLTPLTVSSTNFGKLASAPVDGYVYAQPLYVHGVTINGTSHDVAYVATEHDSVYAFDVAKNATSGAVTVTQLWQRSFITGGPGGPTTTGITSVPQPDIISGDIVPEIGITGAGVIDTASNTLYVVAKTKEVRADGNHWVQTLHALDLSTGADKYVTTGNGGYVIGDTHTSATFLNETTTIMVPGQGAESSDPTSPNGMVPFSALKENQRPSLQLLNGRVYVAWASHGDNGPYHGWVVGFNETTLQPEKIFNTAPNGGLSGIWQSEGALSTDGRYLYFAVGNGGGAAGFPAFDPAHGNYSESVLKIDTQAAGTIMPVASYFTPFNWQQLDAADADLGSGGVMLLPDSVGSTAHPHLMVETGKDGHIYLLDRDNLGGFTSGGPNNIVQDVVAGPGGVWGNPSFYQESATSGLIFYHGSGSDSRAFRISNGQITSVSGSFIAYRSNQTFGFPGAQPVISANGVNNPSSAVVWELQTDNYGSQGPAVLHAYALPSTSTGNMTELYNSNQSGTRDQLSASVKFTSAITTNGLVFVAQGGGPAAGNPASGTFNVFGLFPPPTQAPAAPTNLTATGLSSTQIRLDWTNPPPNAGAQATAVKVFRSVGDDQHFGTTPVATVAGSATTYTDTVADPNQVYFYKIEASNVIGDSPFSNVASASPFVQPVLSLTNVASNAVALAWTRPPVANNRFDVERSTTTDFASFTTVATGLSTNTTSYTDNSPALTSSPGTYYYRVRAFSTANPTPFALSNVVGVKVGPSAGVINYPAPNGFPLPPAPAPFDLKANGTAQFADTTARLTNATNQTGSVFSTSLENILNWTTSFQVRLHEGTQPSYANGFAFVVQAVASNALGQGQTGLGYQGISNSVALTFDTFFGGGAAGGAVGLFINGNSPGGTLHPGETRIALDPTMVNLDSQSNKVVSLSYAYNAANPSASVLHEVITDPDHPSTPFTHDYTVDIPSLLGIPSSGNTIAYVGFTGSTGSQGFWELQDVLNWVYTPNGPAAPNHLGVVSGTNSNALTWRTTSADDQGYYVERSTSQNSGFTRIATLGAGVTSYNDTGLTNPQQYFYRVQQFNHNGSGGAELDSGYSNVATGALVNVNFTSFPNGNGFVTNTGNPPVTEFPGTPAVMRLTDGRNGEQTSVWYATPIGTGAFTTTFTLKDVPGNGAADSVSFVIQNDARGTAALGGGGGAGGYSGITNSIAIKFDLYTHGSHNSSTGLFTNGQSPDGFPAQDVIMGPTPIDLQTQHPMLITLTYDGGTRLDETVQDTVTNAIFTHTYTLPMTLAQLAGGNTAFVGFTGATGGENATQDILNWTGAFPQAPPQASSIGVGASPTSITAGQTTTITVTAKDQNGGTFPGYVGTVHFTVPNDAQAVIVNPATGQPLVGNNYTFTTADQGVHTFTVTLKTAGNQAVMVVDTARATLNGAATVAVSPAALSTLSVSGFPAFASKGTPGTFTVAAKDAFGNTVPTYTGTVHFTSTDPAAVLPANYMFVAGDMGTHTFSATLNTIGTQSITATDTVNASLTGTQSGINVQQSGVTLIDFSNGFADHSNLTGNGSTAFIGSTGSAVGIFTNHQDVGTPGNPSPAGNASFASASGTYSVSASGSDIWDTQDHFQYVYKTINGDGEIIARVTHIDGTDGWAKAGVMFRASTDTSSPQVSMDFSFANGSSLQWRDTQGAGSGSIDDGGGTAPIPGWIRLVRSGNNFTGYWAPDNNGTPGAWVTSGTHTTPMGTSVLVGLAVTAHNNGAVNTSTFDHVTLTGNTAAPVVRLVDGNNGEAASVWYNTPVSTGPFSTTFQFVMAAGSNPIADGLTFVIQADPRGVNALGQGGGALGYGTDANDGQQPAIQKSVAIKFDAYKGFNTGDGNHSSTGLYINGFRPNNPGSGTVPPGAVPIDLAGKGIDFNAAAQAKPPHPFLATLTYDGVTLTETIKDTVTNATFIQTYTVNIPQIIGGNVAYVGFTAGTGGLNAIVDLQSWTGSFQQAGTVTIAFPNGFADHSSLTANANAQNPPINVFPGGTGAPLQLTDGRGGEATSVFYNTPIGTGAFSTTFTLQDTPANGADSLSFVIQADPAGVAALGGGGGGGGYAGIANSIAVKFDLWNHGNGSPYSTGLFTGGQAPDSDTSKDVSLAPIALGSGHPLLVTLAYDNNTLTETVKDTVTNQTFTHNYTLNLAQVIGGKSAYVGFTAGTGGVASVQKILNWSGVFSPAQATSLRVSAPTNVAAGAPVQVTVTAVDQNGYTLPAYIGTVHFTSSDPAAVLPANYSFKPSDNGVHTFTVTLNTLGAQSITATDTAMGSVLGTQAGINVTLDYSNGFVNHGNLAANGSAQFIGPATPAASVGVFANHQNIGTPGNPSTAGNATFSNGTYTLTASGSDIWDTADHMQYVYEPLVGNGEIIARLNTSNAPDYWTKAGLMIRSDLSAGAQNDFMMYTPNTAHQEPVMQWRDVVDGGSGDTGNHPPNGGNANILAPVWLRLVRSGNTFTGYWATDSNGTPNTWQQIAVHNTTMTGTVFVGLALTAHNNGATAMVTFDHVQVIGNTSGSLGTTVARLTDGANGEAGSIFTTTKVPDTAFTTTFTIKDQAVNAGGADSLNFVLQNDPRGAAALGGGGGAGGYAGIANSIAIKFDLWTNGSHIPTTGLFINGESPSTGDQSPAGGKDVIVTGGIKFLSGDPIQVTLTYNGTTLTETLLDTVTNATFTYDYLVNIPQILGGNTAYVGFTGATGGASAIQDVLSWTYKPTPVPAAASLNVTVTNPTQLVTNGGFETGNFNGWTLAGFAADELNVVTGTAGRTLVHGGTKSGQFGPGGIGTVTQTLNTTPGATYNLDFWLANPIGGTGTEWLVKVGAHGGTLATLTDVKNAPSFNYTHYGFTFTATSTQTDLQFGFKHPPDWFYLDDVSVTPASIVAGTSAPVTVTALDAGGHRVAYTGTVHITTTDPQVPDFGNYTFTAADNGQHVFTGGTLVTAGTQTVTFQDTANNSLSGNASVVITPAAASTFVATASPSTITAGGSTSITVTAKDAYGNTATGYSGTVHFTSNDTQAVLPTNTTLTGGTGTFTATLKTSGSRTVTATDTVNSSLTGTATVTVNPAAASTFVVSAPATATAGSSFSFTVTAKDQYGNTATGYSGTVHFTSSDGPAVLPANSTLTNGTGTFTAILYTAGSQTVTATDTVTSSITGAATVTVNPAAASSFVVSAPATATAGSSFNFTVTAKDAYGNVATGYSGTVHFTSSDGQAALPADATLTNGTGTFSATLYTAGSQTVTATDTANSSLTATANVSVTPAAATTFVLSYPSTVTKDEPFDLTVTAYDAYGNVATGYTGTVTFSSSDQNPNVVLPADYTFTAADGGTHTFSGVSLHNQGQQWLMVTDTADASISSGMDDVFVENRGGNPNP